MLGIFLDSETNGLNPARHKIIELALKLVDLRSGALQETYQSVIKHPWEQWQKSDLKSLEINGFTWEETEQGKDPLLVAEEIIALFTKWKIRRGSALFICQNPSFDRAFFSQIIDADKQEEFLWPYHWLDLASMYWAISIKNATDNTSLPWNTGVSKDHIAASLDLPEEKKPHRALGGVNHLLLCYERIVDFPCK